MMIVPKSNLSFVDFLGNFLGVSWLDELEEFNQAKGNYSVYDTGDNCCPLKYRTLHDCDIEKSVEGGNQWLAKCVDKIRKSTCGVCGKHFEDKAEYK